VRTIVKGKSIDVPEHIRLYAERKMHRLERLMDESTDAVVELSSEPHRSTSDSQIAEVTLIVAGQTLRGHATGASHEACLDAVVDRLERQAVDAREKPRGKVRIDEARVRRAEASSDASVPTETEPSEMRIVKTKRFGIEPMFEEDAASRMEELGHQFFIFVNAESERLCVLYKRRNGDYGLIEPVIAGEYTPGRNGHRG
jgi:putative sigma-54 modulation protein